MIHGRVLRCCGKPRSTPLGKLDPVTRLLEGNFVACLNDVAQESPISYRLACSRTSHRRASMRAGRSLAAGPIAPRAYFAFRLTKPLLSRRASMRAGTASTPICSKAGARSTRGRGGGPHPQGLGKSRHGVSPRLPPRRPRPFCNIVVAIPQGLDKGPPARRPPRFAPAGTPPTRGRRGRSHSVEPR